MNSAPFPSMVGIIPADAGSTLAPVFGWVHRKDHPRRCGEHVVPMLIRERKVGSSPQMRGAHLEILAIPTT